jgi:hypothetical protein
MLCVSYTDTIHYEKRENMTQDSKFASIDRRFPWSFLGFIAGIAFGIFGIYTVFFYAKAPDLRAEIQSATPVFSLRENVQDLDIMFKGQNIREARKALMLISLKLINRGNVPIKPVDFDHKNLISLSVGNGELVRFDILDTSEPYLKKVFGESTTTRQSIQFPPFIMEPSHFIVFRLLVLHNENVRPELGITGKIANVSAIPVLDTTTQAAEPTKGNIAFAGDGVVQFVRVVVYGLGSLIVLVGIIIQFMFISDRIGKHKQWQRRQFTEERIAEFLAKLSERDRQAIAPIAHDIIADNYTKYMSLVSQLKKHTLQLQLPLQELRQKPHFNRDYFLSSDIGLKNLSLLFRIINGGM